MYAVHTVRKRAPLSLLWKVAEDGCSGMGGVGRFVYPMLKSAGIFWLEGWNTGGDGACCWM